MKEADFRQASLEDLRLMLDWAASEGWNPGLEDAEPFHAADPAGFFIAEIGSEPVAAISVVNHSDAFAFLGFYICRPEFRGKGIGFTLWRLALEHAGTRTVGLDGVADQQENYARSGFRRTGASVRYEGVLTPDADRRIRDSRSSDTANLALLDRAANGIERSAFLSAWIMPASTRRTVVLESNGGISGFATARRCRDGVKIGPIVAPDADAALALAGAALARFPSPKAIIDVPSANTALVSRLRHLGFAETFATARMYRGTEPTNGPTLQAIASMELG